MTWAEPRTSEQRKADTLAKLRAPAADVWVSSASVSGDGSARPYLVPLSLAWIDERVVLAVESRSPTARNLRRYGSARLAVGPTRDVVMIDAVLEGAVDVSDAPPALGQDFADQADWDPRAAGDGYLFLVLRPDRIQAWREANEIAGRTLMRGGSWIV
jgi:hypothetical protein